MISQFRFSQGKFAIEFSEFKLVGTDVLSFLDSQSTFAVKTLLNKKFHLTTFLDPQGKVETYGWLLKDADEFIYLVPKSLEEASKLRLNKFLVSEDVEIEEQGSQKWFFILGTEAEGFSGTIFDEHAVLSRTDASGVPEIPHKDLDLWRKLNGWPSFDGLDFKKELINNTRLFDTALSTKKGCYPGQETVSKIATHRGAAYSPVLLESDREISVGTLVLAGSRIGDAFESLQWNEKFYTTAQLLRDFRVEGMELNFETGNETHRAVVRYYPLLKGGSEFKARELYDLGLEDFKHDQLKASEDKLRKSIELNPSFADAYEALGVMLGRQERFQEAIDLMTKLSEVDPDSAMAHTNLSLYLMKIGKIEEAENHKSTATLKSFKKFGDEAKEKEAKAAKEKADLEEWARREKMFHEVLEIDPEDTLANYGLGSIAVEKSQWEEARSFLEKVIKEDPKYSVAYLALGRAYNGLGLKDLARDIFKEGIKVAASKGDFMPANQMQSELDRI